MGCEKYKVTINNNKVLGNYPAHTPQEAVKKAINSHAQYYAFSDADTFYVKRGRYTGNFKYGEI